jgi:hypothetical protein
MSVPFFAVAEDAGSLSVVGAAIRSYALLLRFWT